VQAYQFAFDDTIAIDTRPEIATDLGASDTRKVHVFDLGHLSEVVPTMIRATRKGQSLGIKSALPYHPHSQLLVQVVGNAFEALRSQAESIEARAGEAGIPVERAYLAQLFPTVFVDGARGIWHAMAKRQRKNDKENNGWIRTDLGEVDSFIAAAGASIRQGMGKIQNAGLCKGPAGFAIVQQRTKAVTFAHYLVTDTLDGAAGKGRSKPEVVIRAGIRAYLPGKSPLNVYDRYRSDSPRRRTFWPVP
jgi:hypothetical protein